MNPVNFQIFHYSFILVRRTIQRKLFNHYHNQDILFFQNRKKKGEKRKMNFQIFPTFLYTISYE